ncbi:MAG: tyrosine-type recombinase/integrase [Bacteroides sp.]|nr:tyrosine-type recombinase/integrase [Bacteroides sp.]
MDKEKMLGAYLMSLSPQKQTWSGPRTKAICRFLNSSFDISKRGWLDFRKENIAYLKDSDREYILDFLYFHGIRIATRIPREEKTHIVSRLDKVSEKNREKVSEFIEWANKQREYSPASIRMKTDNMIKFFRYFTEFNLNNCRDFLKTMEHEGMHPKTLNIYINTLQQFGEFIKKPVALKKISVQRAFSVENVPTEKEYKVFLDWLLNHKQWKVYWIVRTLGMTGMRLSEILQVRWCDILAGDFYPRCKGKKHRTVYFPKTLISDLKKWLKDNPLDTEELVAISQKTNKALSPRGLSQILKANACKANFPKEKAHCHAFRHFFAKQYLRATKDVIQLAELLGHESVDTTRLYLQKSKEEQRGDINRNIKW